MDKQYTKKAASEWTVEEKVATFDGFHEMASALFDIVVKQGAIHPDDKGDVMLCLMTLLGDGANDYLDECVDEIVDKFLQEHPEECVCDCGHCDKEEDPEVN